LEKGTGWWHVSLRAQASPEWLKNVFGHGLRDESKEQE
jgi:hypothetical protein